MATVQRGGSIAGMPADLANIVRDVPNGLKAVDTRIGGLEDKIAELVSAVRTCSLSGSSGPLEITSVAQQHQQLVKVVMEKNVSNAESAFPWASCCVHDAKTPFLAAPQSWRRWRS